MATILGDAKIKLTLDVEAAKAELERLSQSGRNIQEPTDLSARGQTGRAKKEAKTVVIQTSRNAVLRQAYAIARGVLFGAPSNFQGNQYNPYQAALQHQARTNLHQQQVANLRAKHGLPPAGQTALQAFASNFSAGKALVFGTYAYLTAKAVQKVINAVEASPKATAFFKGVAPGSTTDAVDAFAGHVSDVVTDLKAKFESFGKAAADEKALAAAALRLGQHIPVGGAVDLFHWLQLSNEREERMRARVDKELDREIMQKLGEHIRVGGSVHR